MKRAVSTIAIATMLSSTLATPAFASMDRSGGVVASINQETISQIKSRTFDLYNHSNYLWYSTMFEVKPISYVNNGGQYSSSSLNKAFDNNMSTHWETGKPNSATFKNTVTVAFDKVESINRLVYAVRQDNGYKGYPRQIKIYSSLTDTAEDFKLAAEGSSTTQKALVEFKFNSCDFKRLRIEFVDAHDNWASASELKFFKEDKVSDEIEGMFVNRTYSALHPQYNSLEKISQLEQSLLNHPIKDKYTKLLEIAKKVVKNEIEINGRVINPVRVGDIKRHSSNNLKFSLGMNLQSTGIYAIPGETVTLYVEAKDSGPIPQVVFSQNDGSWKDWARTISLRPGINEIVVPDIPYGNNYPTNPKKGGAIYIVNPYTEGEQTVAPSIRIEGGNKFPLFNEGEDPVAFKQELIDYKSKLDKDNSAGTNKVLDIVELNSDRMMLAGTTTGAYEAYVTKGLNPNDTARFWDESVEKLFEIYKLDKSKEIHDPKFTKEQIRLMQPFGAMYAAGDHIGVQKNMMVNIHNPEAIKKGSWGVIHELGHRMDVPSRTWAEVSNNVVSLMMSYHYGSPNDRVAYEDGVYRNVAPDTRKETFDQVGVFARLGMFWQLQVYDNTYWSKLNFMYREKNPSISNEQNKRDILIEYSSEVLGLNLGEYFKRHGFEASQATLDKISKYPKPNKKIWYLRGSAIQYTGAGFTANVKPEITDVALNAQNKTNTVMIKINKEDVNNILGYEIYKDGKIIGFTSKDSYIDTNIDPNVSHKYEVVAYDMKLNPTSKVMQPSQAPTIKSIPDVTLKLNESFNPLNYVVGISYKKEDISNLIKVKSNNVDTTKKGVYTVVYELTDRGITTTQAVNVSVISNQDYASDLSYTINAVGTGGIKKDLAPSGNPIKLLVGGIEKRFYKGIGANANSEITYDLTGKSYEYFTANIGIDGYVRNSLNPSVKFKIIGDGKVIYESKIFKSKDESEYIKIPVGGIKQLKLITDMANGNDYADHSVWGNAKFISNTENPPVNVSSFSYLSDSPWKSATTGYGTIKKDKSVDNNLIRLTGSKGEVITHKKGIGTHSNSTIIYDLTGKSPKLFTSYIGVDREMYGSVGSVVFQVYVDGVKKYDSGLMKSRDPQKYIELDINGAKELRLVVTNGENGIGSDHGSWGDTKIYSVK